MVKRTTLWNTMRGFTLLELIVVTLIIGLLAAFAVPTYIDYLNKARITVSIALLDSMQKELEAYALENGSYPVSINLTDFTDQNGHSVLIAMTKDTMLAKMYSWDSYLSSGGTYTLTARANDANHTILTLTPGGVQK